jgi:hypothetical protein
LPDVTLEIAARVQEYEAIVLIPRNPIVKVDDRLRVGGEEHRPEQIARLRIDVLAELPRAEVAHVRERVGAVLGSRPHLGLNYYAPIGLRAVKALQRLAVGSEEVAIAGRAIERNDVRIRSAEIETTVAARQRAAPHGR